MIIDKAGMDDIVQLKSLWFKAFGDDEKMIELFMAKVLGGIQTYVVREAGVAASVLYAIPTTDNNYYLYALATDSSYRKRGYMSALIRYFIDNTDAGYFFLIPGEPALVPYYTGLGFDIHIPAAISKEAEDMFDENVAEYVMAEIKSDDSIIPDLPDALVCVKNSAAPEAVCGLIPY